MKRSAAFYVAHPLFALAAVASDCAWAADAKIAAGATIYGNYCSNCHGDELRNTSGGATFDLTRLRAADHDRFVNSVLNGKQYVTITNGATGPYVMRAGDPNLANVPAGGSIWTFKIFEEYSGPQRAASAN